MTGPSERQPPHEGKCSMAGQNGQPQSNRQVNRTRYGPQSAGQGAGCRCAGVVYQSQRVYACCTRLRGGTCRAPFHPLRPRSNCAYSRTILRSSATGRFRINLRNLPVFALDSDIVSRCRVGAHWTKTSCSATIAHYQNGIPRQVEESGKTPGPCAGLPNLFGHSQDN